MADITMCNGNYCELAKTCYRYKAEPSKYNQSYFVKEPNIKNQCDYYWEVCEYCNQENGKHKLSCATMKIQVNL
jgi:hypothetical protein